MIDRDLAVTMTVTLAEPCATAEECWCSRRGGRQAVRADDRRPRVSAPHEGSLCCRDGAWQVQAKRSPGNPGHTSRARRTAGCHVGTRGGSSRRLTLVLLIRQDSAAARVYCRATALSGCSVVLSQRESTGAMGSAASGNRLAFQSSMSAQCPGHHVRFLHPHTVRSAPQWGPYICKARSRTVFVLVKPPSAFDLLHLTLAGDVTRHVSVQTCGQTEPQPHRF